MPHYTRGKIQFEHHNVGTVESSEDVVATYSCHPPPAGRRTRANPQLTYAPHQPASFVQPEERRRIVKFAANASETLALSTVIAELKASFKINTLTIDLKGIPQAWRRPEPCFDHTIAIIVKSVLLRIDAVATQSLTLDRVTWPKGDALAQFRIIVPDQYRFIRHKTRNLTCCPLKDGEPMPQYEPERQPWSDPNFVDFSFVPLKLEMDWGLGLDYRYRYLEGKWNLGELRYLTEEELAGESEPKQPWILPHPKFGF